MGHRFRGQELHIAQHCPLLVFCLPYNVALASRGGAGIRVEKRREMNKEEEKKEEGRVEREIERERELIL